MKRREFLNKATIASLAGGTTLLTGCQNDTPPKAPAQIIKRTEWEMAFIWPMNSPLFIAAINTITERIKVLSDDRLRIHISAPQNQIPELGIFDAVSRGQIQCGVSSPYYWATHDVACQWFSAVPFGLNAQGQNAWLYSGGGLELWDTVYGQFNILGRPFANTGAQMGGWFNKKMESLADFKKLKLRMPGLGGKVATRAGAKITLLLLEELAPAFEQGLIDAVEWIGPLHDLQMGFYNFAQYYYYPGWQEPGTCLDIMFNKDALEALPSDIQAILFSALVESNLKTLSEFEAQNSIALQTLTHNHGVKLKAFPKSLLKELHTLSVGVLQEEASKSKMATKVHKAYSQFQSKWRVWQNVSTVF